MELVVTAVKTLAVILYVGIITAGSVAPTTLLTSVGRVAVGLDLDSDSVYCLHQKKLCGNRETI